MGEKKMNGEKEIEAKESEGSVVTTSKVIMEPRTRTIKMKNWNDNVIVYSPNGIDFIVMSHEQLTVYTSFISRTTICASKETIKVEDKTNDDFVHVTYEGQKFHE
jgi:hypothetical protein